MHCHCKCISMYACVIQSVIKMKRYLITVVIILLLCSIKCCSNQKVRHRNCNKQVYFESTDQFCLDEDELFELEAEEHNHREAGAIYNQNKQNRLNSLFSSVSQWHFPSNHQLFGAYYNVNFHDHHHNNDNG